MLFIFFKIILTSIIIVIISEIAKFSDRFGGLIAAMPITTFIILFWLYFEDNSISKLSSHMTFTLIYLIPTVPMFLVFPFCIYKFGFWITILICIVLTLFSTLIVHQISKSFNISLF